MMARRWSGERDGVDVAAGEERVQVRAGSRLGMLALRGFGNAGLWGALLAFYAARGGLEAARYPALLKASFRPTS